MVYHILVAWFRYSFYGLYIDQYYRYIILPNRWVIIYQYHNHRYVSSHFTIYNGYPRWLIISGDSSSAWALFGCPRGRRGQGTQWDVGRSWVVGRWISPLITAWQTYTKSELERSTVLLMGKSTSSMAMASIANC